MVSRLEAEARDLPTGDAARRELAVADQVLAQRRELAIIAARISPPAYVKAFGREVQRGAERARQQAATRLLQEIQRALGFGAAPARARQLGRGLSIGR